MPIRRRQPKKSKKSVYFAKNKLVYLLILVLFVLGLFFFFKRPANLWDGKTRLTLAAQLENGDVLLANFDPLSQTITRINIPGETEVQVAHQLGTWRLKSVWKLGEQEGIQGEILSKTIVKTFHFPVEAWSEPRGAGLAAANTWEISKSLFADYKTNLSFWDKVNLAFFSLTIKARDRLDFSLINAGYLYETKLVDGKGFRRRTKVPASVSNLFADSAISQENLRISVLNASGDSSLAGNLVETVEMMGGRVVSVKNLKKEAGDCAVIGRDSLTKREIEVIFSCSEESRAMSGDFDIEIYLGEAYPERF
jgi:hypothetical protein